MVHIINRTRITLFSRAIKLHTSPDYFGHIIHTRSNDFLGFLFLNGTPSILGTNFRQNILGELQCIAPVKKFSDQIIFEQKYYFSKCI